MAFDPLSSILEVGGKIIDKIFPDKNEAEKAKVKMAELAMQGQLEELKLLTGQLEINKAEAMHNSKWVAGWRPFIGWVCGSALAWHYIVMPFLVWALSIFSITTTMPALDMGELMTILLGILGLGAYRTYEKTKNGK